MACQQDVALFSWGSHASAPAVSSRLPLVHSLGPRGSSFNPAFVCLPCHLQAHGNVTFSQRPYLTVHSSCLVCPLPLFSVSTSFPYSTSHRALTPCLCAYTLHICALECGPREGRDFVLFMALQLQCSVNGYHVRTVIDTQQEKVKFRSTSNNQNRSHFLSRVTMSWYFHILSLLQAMT